MKFIAFFESLVITVSCFFGSVFNLPDKNVRTLKENNGGMIYGVCHPNEQYDALKDAGLGWVRFDIPYPYNAAGEISRSYTEFKDRCRGYAENGMRVMAVTPYPKDYVNIGGFNPAEDIERTKEIAVFLYNDLRDITGAFQITNEMGLATFTYPLSLEEAATFIGVQLEAIDNAKKEAGDTFMIGYNQANVSASKELNKLLKPYLRYCDYVGIDLYIGVQTNDSASDYSKRIKKLYRQVCKPVIVTEFGFWSEGGSKTEEEKKEILGYYGYSSEEEAIADGENFISKLPSQFRNTLFYEFPGQEDRWAEIVFSECSGHFYGQTSDKTLENVGFTPEGQAEYFRRVISEMQKLNCLAGMIIYCCQDMAICWTCGQNWCPYETKWGIFNIDGTPKPAYYAIKETITGNGG